VTRVIVKIFATFFILAVSSVIYITESWEEYHNCVIPDILKVCSYSVLKKKYKCNLILTRTIPLCCNKCNNLLASITQHILISKF